MKWVEVALMSSVAISLFAFPENGFLRLLLLGLMGAQSALFSPAKYGILPELLPHEQLSKGNAYLEMWTFLAIILGTAGGGLLLDSAGERIWLPGLILTLTAAVGLFYAHRIPAVAPARPDGNLLETLRSSWRTIRGERILGLAVAGSVTYWTIVSLLGQDILVYGRTVLGLSDTASGLPLAAFGLGVGMGSLVAGKLSGEKVEYGLIPLGAILMALVSALLALLSPGFAGLLVSTSLLGIASGFIVVPINALVQWQAPASRRGGIIALANVFVFGGILVGSLSATLLAELSFSPQLILSVASLAILLGTLWALWLLPYALLRLGLILLTHTFYRLTVLDRDQVPKEGGVLLTPNHVSFVDALMLIASLDRPVRFIVDQSYFEYWLFRPFMKSMGNIPISSSGGPRVLLKALREAGQYLDDGEVVCIFPEGQITRIGSLLPFPPRLRTDRQKPTVAHRSRLSGSPLGEYLQSLRRALSLQDSETDSLPGNGSVRGPDVSRNSSCRDTPAGPGIGQLRLGGSTEKRQALTARLHTSSPTLALRPSLRRRAETQCLAAQGTHRGSSVGEGTQECLGGSDPPGNPLASQRRWCARQSCGFSFGWRERESELHCRPCGNGLDDPSG